MAGGALKETTPGQEHAYRMPRGRVKRIHNIDKTAATNKGMIPLSVVNT